MILKAFVSITMTLGVLAKPVDDRDWKTQKMLNENFVRQLWNIS